MKETFIVRTEWAAAILELEPADQATIFQNLFHFHSGNENLINLNNLPVKLIWRLIEPSLIRTVEKYDKRCETSAANGKKGGRPKKEASENLNNLNKPTSEPNEKAKPNESLSDSVHDHDSDLNTHTHSKKSAQDFPESSFLPDQNSEDPNPVAPPPSPFPGTPVAADIPEPPDDTLRSIAARQYQMGYGSVSEQQVLEYWHIWVPSKIKGQKFFNHLSDVYDFFFNSCQKLRIVGDHQTRPRPGGGFQNGSAAGTARGRGATIEDLQKLKRRPAPHDSQRDDFAEAEIVE